jgi:hypothetical protein
MSSQRIDALREAQHAYYKQHARWPDRARMHPVFLMHLKKDAELWSWSWGPPGDGLGKNFEGLVIEETKAVHAFEVYCTALSGGTVE